MNRQIIMLTGCGVVALLLCLGCGYFLFDAWSDKSDLVEERSQKMSELNAIYNAKVFPCAANQQRLEKDAEEISAWRTVASNLFQKGKLKTDTGLTPSGFKQQLVRDIAVLQSQFRTVRKNAEKGSKFGFDFDHYLGSTLPSSKHVARLSTQLEMLKVLCAELKKAGVVEINDVEREKFDAVDGADSSAQKQETTGRRRRSRRSSSQEVHHTAASADSGIKPYAAKERFELSFAARPDVLIKVMNSLASMDMFVTVVETEIHKEQDMFKDFINKRSAQEAKKDKGKLSAKEEKSPLDAAAKLPVRETVTDSELDAPASVNLIVDVYTF